MYPSPTNYGSPGVSTGGDQPSLGAPPAPPGSTPSCSTAAALPNQPFYGPTKTGPAPSAINPQLPSTAKLPPTSYTPTTLPGDAGSGAFAAPERQQALMSLSQQGALANTNTSPLFRLTYGNALGLGQSGDSRDPLPLYNPFQGATK